RAGGEHAAGTIRRVVDIDADGRGGLPGAGSDAADAQPRLARGAADRHEARCGGGVVREILQVLTLDIVVGQYRNRHWHFLQRLAALGRRDDNGGERGDGGSTLRIRGLPGGRRLRSSAL